MKYIKNWPLVNYICYNIYCNIFYNTVAIYYVANNNIASEALMLVELLTPVAFQLLSYLTEPISLIQTSRIHRLMHNILPYPLRPSFSTSKCGNQFQQPLRPSIFNVSTNMTIPPQFHGLQSINNISLYSQSNFNLFIQNQIH